MLARLFSTPRGKQRGEGGPSSKLGPDERRLSRANGLVSSFWHERKRPVRPLQTAAPTSGAARLSAHPHSLRNWLARTSSPGLSGDALSSRCTTFESFSPRPPPIPARLFPRPPLRLRFDRLDADGSPAGTPSGREPLISEAPVSSSPCRRGPPDRHTPSRLPFPSLLATLLPFLHHSGRRRLASARRRKGRPIAADRRSSSLRGIAAALVCRSGSPPRSERRNRDVGRAPATVANARHGNGSREVVSFVRAAVAWTPLWPSDWRPSHRAPPHWPVVQR
jgi:hypothetical protein